MASPDLTPYVDLTFFDKDPQDVYDAAVLDLQTKLPEWVPREGNIEVLLLESLALQVAEAIFAANRLPGAVVMAMLRMYGIEPDPGSLPVATLQFQVSDDRGHEIPAGTSAVLQLASGLEPVVFETDEALVVPVGSITATVAATGDRWTDEANGVAAGAQMELLDSVAFVDRVTLASAVSGGKEPEEDDEWIERGVQRFSRLSETLVLPKHFESAALEYAAVTRVKALDNWNGSTGAPGDHPGHVTVALYGEGAPVAAATKTEIEAALSAATMANLAVHVIDPVLTAVAVTVTVKRVGGYDDAAVKAAITERLGEYLSAQNWDWAKTVRRNELITEISNTEGVEHVVTLTAPAADVVLPGQANLATLGTLTITTE